LTSVRILIADDHQLVREGIRARLEKHPGWTICAEAANGREAVEAAKRERPDVAVIDVRMPELNGIEAAIQIRRECPGIEVLMLTFNHSEENIRQALAAGVRGFILKSDASRLLDAAIEALLRHQPFFTGVVGEQVLDGFLNPTRVQPRDKVASGRLSGREREIVQLLAESRTSKEIAARLGVSVKTVNAHRANIMRKLDLHSVAELVRYAVRNGIIQA
jgi:DNA-binding NarL/FixJ family response regulator